MLLALSASVGNAAQPVSLEYAVKANYLYKFAPFVDWPPQAFQTPASPFVICLIGAEAFGNVLDDAVRKQKVGNHPIQIKHLTAAPSGGDCHMLYIGRSTALSAGDVLASVAGQPVLTVTDQSRGILGGMIEFLMDGGRVRFQIDEAGARASHIAISSKLLGLAVTVHR